MPVSNTDRNLLFGVLALQNDFISREDLIAAVSVWLTDKSQALGEILLQRQALRQDEHELLAALTRKHLERHGDDAQKSLTALSSLGSLRDELKSLGAADLEVEASLSLVGRDRETADPFATAPHNVGAATSAGTRFVILRPHAKGGLGEVFVAQDGELHRQVALKQIQQQYADAPDSRARFLLEAEITGGLEHPGIVPVYGLGQYANGRPFYAMRLISGDSLQQAVDRFYAGASSGGSASPQTEVERTLEFRKLLGRFIDICNAIEYAHSRGVLHRDLKPGNIMLGKYGETLVVDWGLAKVQGLDEKTKAGDEATLRPSAGSGSAPTMMGQAIGTPAYMPPEQAAGKLDQLGPPSDVYSLGATLYCVLTGRSAFPSQDLGETLRKVQSGEFPRPCDVNPRVPKPLEAICVRAMALRPADRYASPQELADDVERYLADEPVTAHAEPVLLRARRWLRKHPKSVTALAATLLVGLASLVVIATVVSGKNRQLAQANSEERKAKDTAAANAQRADAKAAEAIAERDRADKKALEARRNLYFSHMNLAQAAWKDARVGRLRELLNEHAPKPGEPDQRGFEWYYLDRLAHSWLLDLKGHEYAVTSVAFSPDGQRLASASLDQTVKVWDAATGQELLTLKGHNYDVMSVAFSPDGQQLASASSDQTVKVWDVATGQETLTLKGHTQGVYGVAFSPDGQRLASASSDKTVKVWDAVTGRESHTMEGHVEGVWSVAFSPDGQRLASASLDGTVKVWGVSTRKELLTLKGHAGAVHSVAFSPDSQRLASASSDRTVKVWDADTGQEVLTLNGHTDNVTSVVFSPDGQRLVSASSDQTVTVWDTTMWQESFTLKGHTQNVTGVAFSPNGQWLASASWDRAVKVWDAVTGQEPLTLKGHTEQATSVAFSPDGQRLASASFDQTIKVWDAATGQALLTLKGHTNWVRSVAFSPDGQRLASASSDKTVKVWDVATGQESSTLKGHTEAVYGVAFSPDGQRLASASYDGTVKVWDVATGQESLVLKGHAEGVFGVAFSPDGQRLASASLDRTVKVWDAATGQESLTLKGHIAGVTSVTFSRSGQWLASASVDQTVKVWDAATGQETLTLKGHTYEVSSVAFSPDGQRLASASLDATVKVWDAATGQESLTLTGRTKGGLSVAFSPDGQRLAAAQGFVKVWDATPRR